MESDPAVLSTAERLAGLGRVTLMIVGLYILTSVLTGLTVYLMNWSGQHVLRQLRVELFNHLHRLSLGYFSEQETGNLMSRITNDTDTIQQVFNFGLISVISGMLLIVWIAISMFQASVAYALVSLAIVPFMIIATLWFSSQARKAFRQTRLEMGSVNAELQETISAVREVQAFSREQENIDNFMLTNAANRDANIRAVSFTSAPGDGLSCAGDRRRSRRIPAPARSTFIWNGSLLRYGYHLPELCSKIQPTNPADLCAVDEYSKRSSRWGTDIRTIG
jgi:ATP-binding cassette subfamily B protein